MADVGSVLGALFEHGRAPEVVLDLEELPVPLAILAEEGPRRFTCLAANDAMAATQRVTANEHFTDVRFEDLVPDPRHRAGWLDAFEAALEVGGCSDHRIDVSGRSVRATIQVHHPGGGRRLLVVTSEDLTAARGRREAALAQLEAVIADSSVLVSMVDVVSQTRLVTNQALAELHGRSVDELRGSSMHQPMSVGLYDAMQTLLHQLVQGLPEARGTVRLQSWSGQERPLAVVATWVPSDDDELQALVQMVESRGHEPSHPFGQALIEAVLEVIGQLAAASGAELDAAIAVALARLGELTGARVVELWEEPAVLRPRGGGGGVEPRRSWHRPGSRPTGRVPLGADPHGTPDGGGPDGATSPAPAATDVADHLGVPWATLAPLLTPEQGGPTTGGAILLGADEPLHADLVHVGRWLGSVVVAALQRRRLEQTHGA